MCIFSICILWVYNNSASPGDQVLSLLNLVVTMVTTKEMHINHMKIKTKPMDMFLAFKLSNKIVLCSISTIVSSRYSSLLPPSSSIPEAELVTIIWS